jgi:PAS domain S-box-containing protein
MSILIVSPDGEAAHSLSSALARSGRGSSWRQSIREVRTAGPEEPPLVVVVDRAASGFEDFISDVRRDTPWVRVYEIAGADSAASEEADDSPALLRKPFDAAELAALLSREQELAEIDRQRHSLEEETEELALLVEASFEAIIGLGPDGSIRSWNRGAAKIYGYAAEDVLGRSIQILEVDDGVARERLRSIPGEPIEVLRRRSDGQEIVVLLSVSPVGKGVRFAYAETSLDVTVRRQLERELEHEKRLAAIGRIAAAMAHEINNPLAVVRAANAYVAEVARASRDELLVETVEDVRLAVDRIGSFVNHVCGFSRRDRPTMSDSSVRESVRMALRLAKPRAQEQRVDMLLEPGTDMRLPHDAARLSQAVLNLVSNAIDAAGEGGSRVTIRLTSDGASLRIQVDDDGPGVPDSVRDRVFEPFTTTKPQGRGTGLGLAITRQIVDDHGGAVSLTPAPGGRGTRAEIVLPLVARRMHQRPMPSSRPPRPRE